MVAACRKAGSLQAAPAKIWMQQSASANKVLLSTQQALSGDGVREFCKILTFMFKSDGAGLTGTMKGGRAAATWS